METFSKWAMFKLAWARFRAHPWVLLGILVATTVVGAVSSVVVEVSARTNTASFVVANVVDLAIQIITGMVVTYALLRVYDGEPLRLASLASWRTFAHYTAVSVASLLAVVVGLALFIIPGIVAALGLAFAPYVVIDKRLGFVEAMRESWRLTRGHRVNLFLFALLLLVFNVVGMIPFGLGLLITVPVSALAMTAAYRFALEPDTEHAASLSWVTRVSTVVLGVAAGLAASLFLMWAVFGGALAGMAPALADGVRLADIATMRDASVAYRADNGVYPAVPDDMVPEYLDAVPFDPITGEPYSYTVFDDGESVEVCALLERREDPFVCEYAGAARESVANDGSDAVFDEAADDAPLEFEFN